MGNESLWLNSEYLCFSQDTLILPCNPNVAFVYDLQTTVGLYNCVVSILPIPNTLKNYVWTIFLFMPALVQLETKWFFLNCLEYFLSELLRIFSVDIIVTFGTSSTNNLPFSHLIIVTLKLYKKTSINPIFHKKGEKKPLRLVAADRWYLAVALLPFIIQRVNVII